MIKALIEIVTGSVSIMGFLSSARRFFGAGSLFLSSIALAAGDAPLSGRGPLQQTRQAASSDWQIECVAPGRAEPVSLTMNDSKFRYALPRGVTFFILHLEASGQRRCFTLENENTAAQGRLSISISNERLAANNPRWSVVDGAVSFRHKRLFALSLIGVEAKFVKLTFQVDDLEKITQRDQPNRPANRFTMQP